MCKSDLDDLVTSKVGSNRSVLATLANNVGLVGLLPVHAHAVLVREDGNSLEGQLVGGTEDTDGDLAAVGHEDLLEVHDAAVRAETRVHRVGGGVSLAVGVWGAILVVVSTVGHDGGPVACRVVGHGCVCVFERVTAKSLWRDDCSIVRRCNASAGQHKCPMAAGCTETRAGGVGVGGCLEEREV